MNQAITREHRREAMAARNAAVLVLAKGGMGPTGIGRLLGLTKNAVQGIVSRHG